MPVAGDRRGSRIRAPLRAGFRGFRAGTPTERGGFAILSASAATISVSRALNYIRERKRRSPALRGFVRQAHHLRGGGLRVHHFLPGIAITGAAGAAAILLRQDGWELRFSLPFGIGAGLTLDEAAFLVERNNPYWGTQRLALIEAAAASAGAIALGARLVAKGR